MKFDASDARATTRVIVLRMKLATALSSLPVTLGLPVCVIVFTRGRNKWFSGCLAAPHIHPTVNGEARRNHIPRSCNAHLV